MLRRASGWIVAIAIMLALAAIIFNLLRPRPVRVIVAEVATGEVRETVANTRAGTVKACRRAKLSPPVGGQISLLPVTEGDQVAAGELLLQLWGDDLEAQMRLAERDVVAAGARAEEACAQSEVSGREAARVNRLRERGLSSEEDADVASGQARASAAACRAMRSNVSVAEARVEVAAAALDRMRLTAPFAGTVAEVNGEVGEFVTPSPVGIATPPAIDLVDTSCIYIAAPIDEVDAPAIRVGMRADVTLDAFRDRRFPGTVRRIAPYVLDIEKQARTVEIEAEIAPDAATGLLPGYSADIEVIIAVREDVLRVPTEAVFDRKSVLVLDRQSGLLEQREVRTGLSNWEFTEILEGLADGERIVVSLDREGVAAGVAARAE